MTSGTHHPDIARCFQITLQDKRRRIQGALGRLFRSRLIQRTSKGIERELGWRWAMLFLCEAEEGNALYRHELIPHIYKLSNGTKIQGSKWTLVKVFHFSETTYNFWKSSIVARENSWYLVTGKSPGSKRGRLVEYDQVIRGLKQLRLPEVAWPVLRRCGNALKRDEEEQLAWYPTLLPGSIPAYVVMNIILIQTFKVTLLTSL